MNYNDMSMDNYVVWQSKEREKMKLFFEKVKNH